MEMSSEKTSGKQVMADVDELERGGRPASFDDRRRDATPSTTTMTGVSWAVRLMSAAVVVVVVLLMYAQVVQLERRVDQLELMMALSNRCHDDRHLQSPSAAAATRSDADDGAVGESDSVHFSDSRTANDAGFLDDNAAVGASVGNDDDDEVVDADSRQPSSSSEIIDGTSAHRRVRRSAAAAADRDDADADAVADGDGDEQYGDDDEHQMGDDAASAPVRHARPRLRNGQPPRGRRNNRQPADSDTTRQSGRSRSHIRKSDVAMVLNMHVHPHGNDLRVGSSYTYKSWRVAEWARLSQLFVYDHATGKITVKRSGIYFVYAQIHYHNAATRSSYAVMVGNSTANANSQNQLVKCWSSVDVSDSSSQGDNARFKSCYVGIATQLDRDQHVWVDDLYGTYVRPDPESSYFGIIKLADIN